MSLYFTDLDQNVRQALAEDLGTGDITANLIPAGKQAQARVIVREEAIICGLAWFNQVFKQVDPSVTINWHCEDGMRVKPNDLLCEIKGSARAILTAERTALNFLQTLSATATITASYVAALVDSDGDSNGVGHSKTQLLDTRKTLPGLRLAQKYAVKCGGGRNHRFGLYDAILIKENHIMACGGLFQAVQTAKQQQPEVLVEVETENLDEVQQALDAKADIIMLDNFSIEMIEQAVKLNNNQAKLEVSGNIEIEQLARLAATGVDYISTGAITKHIRAIDLSMRFHFI
ncbi:carboxylating nicotinate-nucleotide diphosphorylase [Thiomicrospira microaerophila]|uniref:carboxylating nicotinate-nucleotide diphosphorylase n=1 Tax=Thiomicrospira microaerophila TaxID=406020 RepID=UPI0005C85165|nr:carboxylating nicotinate-nucleotide diphosphorylase [Thiomicrospira microaerophila]